MFIFSALYDVRGLKTALVRTQVFARRLAVLGREANGCYRFAFRG